MNESTKKKIEGAAHIAAIGGSIAVTAVKVYLGDRPTTGQNSITVKSIQNHWDKAKDCFNQADSKTKLEYLVPFEIGIVTYEYALELSCESNTEYTVNDIRYIGASYFLVGDTRKYKHPDYPKKCDSITYSNDTYGRKTVKLRISYLKNKNSKTLDTKSLYFFYNCNEVHCMYVHMESGSVKKRVLYKNVIGFDSRMNTILLSSGFPVRKYLK